MAIKDRIKEGSTKKRSEAVKEMAMLGGVEVEVRKMTLGARGRVLDRGYRVVNGKNVPNYPELYPILLVETVFDPATGEHVFTTSKEDKAIMLDLDAEEVDVVAEIAFRLAGLDKKTGTELGKDSGETQTGESASD